MRNLLDIINDIKGCQFAHITYISDCKFPKKSGLGNVTKVVSTKVQINYDYETAVNNRLAKAGQPTTFSADKLPWGVWETPNKVILHKGEHYLRFYTTKGGNISTTYYVNGVLATAQQVADIKAYLATKDTKSAKQTASGLTDNQVSPKNVAFSNILTLAVNKETYTAPTKAVA